MSEHPAGEDAELVQGDGGNDNRQRQLNAEPPDNNQPGSPGNSSTSSIRAMQSVINQGDWSPASSQEDYQRLTPTQSRVSERRSQLSQRGYRTDSEDEQQLNSPRQRDNSSERQEKRASLQRENTRGVATEAFEGNQRQTSARYPRPQIFSTRDAEGSGLGQFNTITNRDNAINRNDFNPTKHSTGRRGNDNEYGQFRRSPAGFEHSDRTTNSTQKQIRVQPFPKDVKAADKLFRWKYWMSTMELALEKANIFGQRERAVEVSLAAGEEVGIIIMTEGLMVKPEDVQSGFRFYDYLTAGIADFFGRLTDGSVNAREFNKLKQGANETARDYALRAKLAAQKIGLDNKALITANFIDGIADSSARDWATSFNMSMEEALTMMTRRENQPSKTPQWNASQRDEAPLAVALVRKRKSSPEHDRSSERSNSRSVKKEREDRSERDNRRGNFGNKPPCKRCGRHEHRGPMCPAERAKCHNCGKIGHFGIVCNAREVRNVYTSAQDIKVKPRMFPERD